MKKMRGYITSQNNKVRVPQHIQNLVIRDYCHVMGFHYLLSVTEHVMPGCYMILEQVLKNLDGCDGIVLYSVFQLPILKQARHTILKKIIAEKKEIHFSLERMSVIFWDDIDVVDELLQISSIVALQEKRDLCETLPNIV